MGIDEKELDSAISHCERASDSLQRAVTTLEETAKLRRSIARLRVSSGTSLPPAMDSAPPAATRKTTLTLVREADGTLRVKES